MRMRVPRCGLDFTELVHVVVGCEDGLLVCFAHSQSLVPTLGRAASSHGGGDRQSVDEANHRLRHEPAPVVVLMYAEELSSIVDER